MPRKSEKDKIIDALCLQYYTNSLYMDSSTDSSGDEDAAFDIFHSSIVSTMRNRRGVHLRVPKSEEWRVHVLDQLDDFRFSQMLRVTPAEFNYILSLIKNDPVLKSCNKTDQLPLKLQLQITLYRLGCSGEGANIRKVASVFGVGDGGTLQIVTRRIIKAIINLKQQFIYWPNEEEKKKILLRSKMELPGCIGYLDGTEIKLAEAPAKNHEMFFSRKRQYSIKMQAVCDDNLKIRQASYGHAGSVHDARIFVNSAIGRCPTLFFGRGEWIAADSAYALTEHVITPFRKNSNERRREERELFNTYFSKYRVRVENCFGKLKEKFGSLKELKFRLNNISSRHQCNKWILACCILHNALIDFNMQSNSVIINDNDLPQLPYANKRDWLLDFIKEQ